MPEMQRPQRRGREKAILVGVQLPEHPGSDLMDSLQELARLADTYGVDVAETITQSRVKFSPATLIGEGKALDIAEKARQLDVTLLIFDEDLLPVQHKNLETLTGLPVMDRCGLILEIFRRNARTYEAQIQVELARLNYLLPRLTHAWSHFQRQRGGVNLRGAGETQLEVDRRMVRERIKSLEKKLREIEKQRDTRRRHRENMFRVSLVGYTNSGKSTLMNNLTSAHVHVEDRLFATLDATVRHIDMPHAPRILLADTVGFIRKLPHGLVASFKSTLEEVHESDLLLHVVDISDPGFKNKIQATVEVLAEMGCEDIPRILVFNKLDLLEGPSKLPAIVRSIYKNSISVSGHTGEGVPALREMIHHYFFEKWEEYELVLDYDRAPILSTLYQTTKVENVTYEPHEIRVTLRASKAEHARVLQEIADFTRERRRHRR